jgi:hypothetical protein
MLNNASLTARLPHVAWLTTYFLFGHSAGVHPLARSGLYINQSWLAQASNVGSARLSHPLFRRLEKRCVCIDRFMRHPWTHIRDFSFLLKSSTTYGEELVQADVLLYFTRHDASGRHY